MRHECRILNDSAAEGVRCSLQPFYFFASITCCIMKENKNKGGIDMRRRYTVWNFIWDLIMSSITGGLWLIWIFIREMRNLKS